MKPRERARLSCDGAFDIETQAWSKFVVGGLYLRRDGFSCYRYQRESDFVDRLLSLDGQTIWAHNGGRFDFLWLLDWLVERRISARIIPAGSGVVSIQIANGPTLRDSARAFPLSLARAGEFSGYSKSSTGFECECGRDCGGYCRIRRAMPTADYERLEMYLEHDCRAVVALIDSLNALGDEHGLDMKGTIGASGWATARRWLDLPDAEWESNIYDRARLGYYGGRCQVFRPRAPSGFRADINSAYPAALVRTPLPVGRPRFVLAEAARRNWRADKPGIYSAVVDVPEATHIPPLPVRVGQRICYPVGRFAGVWTQIELAQAESLGASIVDISRALVWPGEDYVLRPFAQAIWDLRHAAGKSTARGKYLKLFANSLTGKLGQHPEIETVECYPSKIRVCPADYECHGVHPAESCCEHECNRRCRAHRPLYGMGAIVVSSAWRIPSSGHVHWSAYLTADARARQLLPQLLADGRGGETAAYCDTDSCYSTERRHGPFGDGLGEWLDEGPFTDFEALAPKTYRLTAPDGPVARSKGIPDALESWADLRAGVTIDRGVATLKTALRGGGEIFRRKDMTRAVRADGVHFGDRILDGTLTRPQTIDALALL